MWLAASAVAENYSALDDGVECGMCVTLSVRQMGPSKGEVIIQLSLRSA